MISALGGKLALLGDKHANVEFVSDEIDKFISDVQVCVGRWKNFSSFSLQQKKVNFTASLTNYNIPVTDD